MDQESRSQALLKEDTEPEVDENMRKYDYDEENAKLKGLQVIFEDGEKEEWEDEEDNWKQ